MRPAISCVLVICADFTLLANFAHQSNAFEILHAAECMPNAFKTVFKIILIYYLLFFIPTHGASGCCEFCVCCGPCL